LDAYHSTTRGKAAINTRLSRMDADERKHMADAAREAQRRKIELEIDPDGALEPEELERRVRYAITARMAQLRLKKRKAQLEREAAEIAALDELAEAGE
jgi:hypothetical protein